MSPEQIPEAAFESPQNGSLRNTTNDPRTQAAEFLHDNKLRANHVSVIATGMVVWSAVNTARDKYHPAVRVAFFSGGGVADSVDGKMDGIQRKEAAELLETDESAEPTDTEELSKSDQFIARLKNLASLDFLNGDLLDSSLDRLQEFTTLGCLAYRAAARGDKPAMYLNLGAAVAASLPSRERAKAEMNGVIVPEQDKHFIIAGRVKRAVAEGFEIGFANHPPMPRLVPALTMTNDVGLAVKRRMITNRQLTEEEPSGPLVEKASKRFSIAGKVPYVTGALALAGATYMNHKFFKSPKE